MTPFPIMRQAVVEVLRGKGWDAVAIAAVVLDRPARRQRSRGLKKYMVAACHSCRGEVSQAWTAAALGVSENTVGIWCKLPDPGVPPPADVDLPRPRPPRRKLPIKPSPTRLLELRAEGLTVKQLASHYGVCRDAIWRWTRTAERLCDVGGRRGRSTG